MTSPPLELAQPSTASCIAAECDVVSNPCPKASLGLLLYTGPGGLSPRKVVEDVRRALIRAWDVKPTSSSASVIHAGDGSPVDVPNRSEICVPWICEVAKDQADLSDLYRIRRVGCERHGLVPISPSCHLNNKVSSFHRLLHGKAVLNLSSIIF